MTMREKPFLEMEADEQREFLAHEFADWISAKLWPTPRTWAFYRRARILARGVGMTFVEVMDVLRCDAEAILAARAGSR